MISSETTRQFVDSINVAILVDKYIKNIKKNNHRYNERQSGTEGFKVP